MNKLTYTQELQKLVNKHGYDSPEVARLNSQHQTALNVVNAGSRSIDVSNQGSQAMNTAYVSNNGLSDSQARELTWLEKRNDANADLEVMANQVSQAKADNQEFYDK